MDFIDYTIYFRAIIRHIIYIDVHLSLIIKMGLDGQRFMGVCVIMKQK